MTTINDIRIISTDWIPRYHDSGYDAVIEALSPQGLVILPFLEATNAAGSQPDMTLPMLLEYISSRKQPPVPKEDDDPPVPGALESVQVLGATLPATPARQRAPTGFGQDIGGIWFSTPAENVGGASTTMLRWYVNGEFTAAQETDVVSNRSIAKATLGCQTSDVVQLAVVNGDVVGWWGRIEIT